MKIVMIGSGNVATIFATRLKEKGHEIVQVYSRTINHAMELAVKVNAGFIDDVKQLNKNADLYIIALADNAIESIIEKIELHDKTMVHTAASVSMEVLNKISRHYGVLYPLQSLNKVNENYPAIPVLINASSEHAKTLIKNTASDISDQVSVVDDEQRLKLHVAAVLVSNYTNHLYAVAEDFCKKEGIDFKLLQPLIAETAMRLKHGSAARLQTGPAKRNDSLTIAKHQQALNPYPDILALYNFLAKSIHDFK